MKLKYLFAIGTIVAVPVLGGGVAYAQGTPTTATTMSGSPTSVQLAPTTAELPSSTSESDVGGANVGQVGNFQSGTQSGPDAGGVDSTTSDVTGDSTAG